MSKFVFFGILAALTFACEPAKSPSTDGGDAAVDAGATDAAQPMTVKVVDAGK